jgi:hypothetical protein
MSERPQLRATWLASAVAGHKRQYIGRGLSIAARVLCVQRCFLIGTVAHDPSTWTLGLEPASPPSGSPRRWSEPAPEPESEAPQRQPLAADMAFDRRHPGSEIELVTHILSDALEVTASVAVSVIGLVADFPVWKRGREWRATRPDLRLREGFPSLFGIDAFIQHGTLHGNELLAALGKAAALERPTSCACCSILSVWTSRSLKSAANCNECGLTHLRAFR